MTLSVGTIKGGKPHSWKCSDTPTVGRRICIPYVQSTLSRLPQMLIRSVLIRFQFRRFSLSFAALAQLGGALRRRAPYGAGRASRGWARFARPGLGLVGCLALRMFRRS